MNALKVQNLVKSFDKRVALNGISFAVPQGQVTGFLGGNGAGKTTTLNCVFEFLKRDAGDVTFFENQKLSENVKARIGYLPERNFSYDHLTAMEFIRFCLQLNQKISRNTADAKIEEALRHMGLFEFRHQRLRTFSKGMLQKTGLIQATIHDPDLIVLDEPMSGLDPDGRQLVSVQISEFQRKGASVFFSSHILSDVEKLCTHLVIIKSGKVIFQGPTDELFKGFDSEQVVEWSAAGARYEKRFASEHAANLFIGEIVKNKGNIISFRTLRPSLEEVFVKLEHRP